MEAAGFVDVETWLHEELTPMEPGDPMETFLATVILRSHLERISEAEPGRLRQRRRRAPAHLHHRLRPPEILARRR